MMADTIQDLKEQYGSSSPALAEQLNSIGVELHSRGDTGAALKFHQEALDILEWNKSNALLYDLVKKSNRYAVDMARTLRKIGNLLSERNDFVGAAEVYKVCLDTFLEGLVEDGGDLKRKLLECEYKNDSASYKAILESVDCKVISRVLCLHPEFRAVVRDISQLIREMQCVKFVGENAGSSRRRRKLTQQAAMEENLKNAVASLSMLTSDSERSMDSNEFTRTSSLSSATSSSVMSENETRRQSFEEKELSQYTRPKLQRVITSDEEDAHYKALSSTIIPAEQTLIIALNRFPLPVSVVGDHTFMNRSSMGLL